jgi:hypothetical protein
MRPDETSATIAASSTRRRRAWGRSGWPMGTPGTSLGMVPPLGSGPAILPLQALAAAPRQHVTATQSTA